MPATLSWNEIKARAYKFVNEWEGETREGAESQTFWNQFFEIFGVNRRRVATFETQAKRLSNRSGKGRIDAFWPAMILIEHKSAGESLDVAAEQATDYFAGLQERELPRAILVCDFQNFRFIDLSDGWNAIQFTLQELPDRVELFGYLAGYERQVVRQEFPLNNQAADLMGSIHDALHNAGYKGHQLEVLLVRMLFCLFAEDTSIFEPGLFREFIETRTQEDGSDFGSRLAELFQTLDTPENERQITLDDILREFPYVNGKLFSEQLRIAAFNREIREKVLAATDFKWSEISPAIFGSLFQAIMEKNRRRAMGAHYTSEESILRLINPLFLDKLREDLGRIKALRVGKTQRLNEFHDRLARVRLFDPACGCGNFLVIAYRELRQLELEVIVELQRMQDQNQRVLLDTLIRVDVDQMAGIELEEWPARIAETALWLTDHQMNRKLLELGTVFVRLPLRKAPTILVGNALRTDWSQVISKDTLSYILGNPPFRGKQYQDCEQKDDMRLVFGSRGKTGTLDYVTAWYRKAAEFIQGTSIECAFVSTSSIAQGEQVDPLWKALAPFKLSIGFAHRPFKWSSEAPGMAAVYVVIIGFGCKKRASRVVFDYPDPTAAPQAVACGFINAYLVADGADVLVPKRRTPLCNVPRAVYGSMPNDNGHLLLNTEEEKAELLKIEPKAQNWIRPFFGSDEFIKGKRRWCLWLVDAAPTDIRNMPEVHKRVKAVKAYREESTRKQTQQLANSPHLFGEIRQPTGEYLLVPEVSSETRGYIPMGYMPPQAIASNLVRTVEEASLFHFGVLTSQMFVVWLTDVGGRLEGRFRFTTGMVYNTFPWPLNATDTQKRAAERAAQAVLDARAKHPNEPMDVLYDRTLMPKELVAAHRTLDRAVDRCYRAAAFQSEAERLKFLFNEYAQLINTGRLALDEPQEPSKPKSRRTRRTVTSSPQS